MDLFVVIFLLTPLPVCYVLVRFLKSHDNELQGRLFGSIAAQVGGVLATYIVVVALLVGTIFPSYLGLNLASERTEWDFQLVKPYMEQPGKPITGRISFENGPRNALLIDGHFESLDGELTRLHSGGLGIYSDNEFYFAFPVGKERSTLTVFGSNQLKDNIMEMRTVNMQHNVSGNEGEIEGSMKLSRAWPWSRLIFVSIIPLMIIYLLSLIGPIAVNIAGSIVMLPERVKKFLGDVNVKIGGATAGYLLIAVISILVLDQGVPRAMERADVSALEECKKIDGKWYFYLHHNYLGSESRIPDYAGKLNVECKDNTGYMDVSGSANKLFDAGYRYTDDISCYESIQPGNGGFSWDTEAAAVHNDKFVGIFKTVEPEPGDGDKGMLFGITNKFEQQKWIFRDFKHYGRAQDLVNAGELLLFRPGNVAQRICTDLSNERIAAAHNEQ